jgi:plastocyanin
VNIEQVAHKWAANAPTTFRTYGNVIPAGRDLFSYGSHFVLARIMLDKAGNRSWFLVNGDRYSVSTSRHQGEVRAAIKATGLPSMIVPFSALREAGIDRDSVKMIDNDPERMEKIWMPVAEADVPEYVHDDNASAYAAEAYRRNGDGWQRATYRHWLGASVFQASYCYTDREHTSRDDDGIMRRDYPEVKGTAYFVANFDENERTPLFFLAQLPKGRKPQTVAEAMECLKPSEVVSAEAAGVVVQRQGDVFAIPADVTVKPADRVKAAYVLAVNHTITESATVKDGRKAVTYGRGVLRHKPQGWGRTPEHKRVKLGDGKTWHQLVRNTVPAGRSWSMGGNVD